MFKLQLTDVNVFGFSAENIEKGGVGRLLVRASFTSDQPQFYDLMKSVDSLISGRAKVAGAAILLNKVHSLLLVVHADHTADLYLNDFQMFVEVRAKRGMQAGEAVSSAAFADIRRARLPEIGLEPRDKILVCFKVGWKFALFFDLQDERDLDIEEMELRLGELYRKLEFQDIYESVRNEKTFGVLLEAGWFPFVEVIGGEFENLLRAYRDEFEIQCQEERLLAAFDDERIDFLAERWGTKPSYGGRRKILESGLAAFKRGDPVACLKVLLTEIEGVLRDTHIVERGQNASVKKLLEYAAESGIRKAGGEQTLFLPRQFLSYLSEYTYASFDPMEEVALSRHSAGHGAAEEESYTMTRALQAILTLDQIWFYL